jgi:hypothetical protein
MAAVVLSLNAMQMRVIVPHKPTKPLQDSLKRLDLLR